MNQVLGRGRSLSLRERLAMDATESFYALAPLRWGSYGRHERHLLMNRWTRARTLAQMELHRHLHRRRQHQKRTSASR